MNAQTILIGAKLLHSLLIHLTVDERLELFGIVQEGYCRYCGSIDPNHNCFCTREE